MLMTGWSHTSKRFGLRAAGPEFAEFSSGLYRLPIEEDSGEDRPVIVQATEDPRRGHA
jgi:hypothetical protein